MPNPEGDCASRRSGRAGSLLHGEHPTRASPFDLRDRGSLDYAVFQPCPLAVVSPRYTCNTYRDSACAGKLSTPRSPDNALQTRRQSMLKIRVGRRYLSACRMPLLSPNLKVSQCYFIALPRTGEVLIAGESSPGASQVLLCHTRGRRGGEPIDRLARDDTRHER